MSEQQIAGGPAAGTFGPGDLPRYRRSRWLSGGALLVVAVLLGLGGGVAYLRQHAARVAPVPASAGAPLPALTIAAVAVEQRPLPHQLVLLGSVVAWDELPVGTEATGLRVVEIRADEGDRVEQGQLLARLNSEILTAQIAQNEAQLQHAKAAIELQQAAITEATATLDQADANMRRASALLKTNIISVEESERRQTTLAAANSKLASARAAIAVAEADEALAKAQHDELTARLAQTEIRAPAAGLITRRSAKLGQVILPGSSAADLFRIVRDSVYELDAEVPERDLPRLHAGQLASVSLDAAEGKPGKPFAAFIRLVAPTVDPQTRMGIAHIRLPADAGFRPGQFLRTSIDIGSAPALIVPEAALVFKDRRPAVFVVDASGDGVTRVAARAIETGIRRDGVVEVVSGLAKGDRVAVTGAGFLKDGDAVDVAPAAGPVALDRTR